MPDDPEYNDATLIELGKLASKLAKNPKTRKNFVKAVKEIEPDRRFPDVEMDEFIEAQKAEREKEKIDREAERLREEMEGKRRVVAQRYEPDDMKQIEALMEKHGLSDYDLGAKLYAADFKPAVPKNSPSYHGQTWDMPTDKELLTDPIKWARRTANAAIDELNSKRR